MISDNETTHFDVQAERGNVRTETASCRAGIADGVVGLLSAARALITGGGQSRVRRAVRDPCGRVPAAKKTSDLIPLRHPIAVTHVRVEFQLD